MMFKYELGMHVKAGEFAGRIVARGDYEDGRIVYCVRELKRHESHLPEQRWFAQADLVADVEGDLPPQP